MKTALEKLKKSQDFNSTCKLDSQESEVIYKLLTDTAIRIAKITEDIEQ